MDVKEIISELEKYKNNEKAEFLPKFFMAYPGGYGEGDKFIGISVPEQRKIARKFKDISLEEVEKLLYSEFHEYRLTALLILTYKYPKSDAAEKEKIVKFYLNNTDKINNWDLVDSSAYKILGPHFYDKDKKVLYDLAYSKDLWEQRIAILSTMYFIKKGKFEDTLKIAEILLNHEHDLIHKAVGWMLREVGKQDEKVEVDFLKKYYKSMPRTMLRYAIERFPKEVRKKYLKGEI